MQTRIYDRWVTNGRSSPALKEFLCAEETQLCAGQDVDFDYKSPNDKDKEEL